ncbi:DUF6443 domain-containing protein [Chitinophaga barathri]|uniref:DUF6443 domain-containing protein n=1 Tax=Chitinophaga barathri TaxID=1647451 RepID=A0A3N4MIK3_9BACT|nr:DUF6443 domain-containing protein [Chitinophaga barathri]RPD39489.1 hypothetical protein EG028_20440 [Chitinophaga barathri]
MFCVALISLTIHLRAQQPDGSLPAAKTARTLPAAYPAGIKVNYIRTWTPNSPQSLPSAVTAATDVAAVLQSTIYYDGLGRPLQTVIKGATSATKKDMVTPVVYDEFGREAFKYLPYIAGSGDGNFKPDPYAGQKTFYDGFLTTAKGNKEDIYYGEHRFEASPLNRVIKSLEAGNNWQGSDKGVTQQYLVNTTGDEVRVWSIAAVAGSLPVSSAAYGAGELYKGVTTDEDNKQVVEYKDKAGRVVMKKVQHTATPSTNHVGWLCTYYGYDDLGNLRYVLPPKVVEYLTTGGGNWTLTAAVAASLCFSYEYDERNRVIVKKVPGAEAVELVYDQRDRQVLSRDGNLRAVGNKWLATIYDNLNRPVMTGIYTTSQTHAQLRTAMGTSAGNTAVTMTTPAPAELFVSRHESGRTEYKARLNVELLEGFETSAGASVEIFTDAGMAGTTETVTSSLPLPGLTAANLDALTYTYYDNYNYPGAKAANTADLTKTEHGGYAYYETPSTSNTTQNLVTGSKVRILDTDQWLITTTRYDPKGRVIQLLSDNVNGGTDVISHMYDFTGKTLSTYYSHSNPKAGATPVTTVLTNYQNDHSGRILKTTKKINNGPAYDIATNTYDDLGQMVVKQLKDGAGNELESLNYTYNIRGWMKGINRDYLKAAGPEAHYFAQELFYDAGFTGKPLNGNIGGVTWKGTNTPDVFAYGYSYDLEDRLMKANFTMRSGSSWVKTKDFDVLMGDGADINSAYDANGNIKRMVQKGTRAGANAVIDDLTYTYNDSTASAWTNKLRKVVDAQNVATTALGDFNDHNTSTAIDYAYDKNGNLTVDENRKISRIHYNLLNLPRTITVMGKGTVSYLYDALGRKHAKIVLDQTQSPNKTTRTDYMGVCLYENDVLTQVSHEEGRARHTGSGVFIYDYFLKDHLGNVRIVLAESVPEQLYLASMEPENAAAENALFSNIDASRANKPVGYPQDPQTSQNTSVAKLNGNDPDRRIGPSLVLKVSAGDTVRIGARAFYKSQGPQKQQKTIAPAADMAAALMRAFGNPGEMAAADHEAVAGANVTPFNNDFVNDGWQRMKEKEPKSADALRPRAYLNFVLFDDEFNLVESSSGVKQVAALPDELQTLAQDNLVMERGGFLYVYTSNETPQDVFFDNLSVLTNPSLVLEENHYYPFGLKMDGISTSAWDDKLDNSFRYNGKELQQKEFSTGPGLEWYDFGARMYDPQIGKWQGMDRYADVYRGVSPYAYSLNNPLRYIDKDGDFIVDKDGKIIATPTGRTERQEVELRDGSIAVAEYEVYTIYTNAGTPVEAWKIKSQEHKDSKGNILPESQLDLSFNCYGYALTSGLFYLPIYEKYNKKADAFLEQILKEEGIEVQWAAGKTNEANAGGFIVTTKGRKQFQHIGVKNNGKRGWNAKHGNTRDVVKDGTLIQAATLHEDLDPNMELKFFEDNRPTKEYSGISIDVSTIRNNTSSNEEFFRKLISIINSLL